MKITSITRKISGYSYDNISATATLGDDENVIDAAKSLDAELRKMLSAIGDQQEASQAAELEKENTVSLLEEALKYAKDKDIPF